MLRVELIYVNQYSVSRTTEEPQLIKLHVQLKEDKRKRMKRQMKTIYYDRISNPVAQTHSKPDNVEELLSENLKTNGCSTITTYSST